MSDPSLSGGLAPDPIVGGAVVDPPLSGAIITTEPVEVEVVAGQGMAGAPGKEGPPGPPAGSSYLTAATALSGHRALMFSASGAAVYADPTSPAYVFAGISLGAAQAGTLVEVSTEGLIVEPSWSWTPGPVFVAPGGLLTQAVPTAGVLHQVATAVSATAVFLYPAPPIILA